MASNMRLTPLADLKPFKTGWKVQVKVLHTWKQYQTKGGESLEIILADEMGTKIHATVKKNLLHRSERLMVVGEWKFIENFSLNQASDVIGRVESVRELETIPVMNKDTSKLEFDLCNAKDERLPCILWGKFGEQVYSACQNAGKRGVIIVIRFGKINVLRGERQITSSFQTSKVLIDLNDPDVIYFKNSLPANGGNITFLISKPHQRISYDDESNFDQFPMVTIAELQDYLECGKKVYKIPKREDEKFCDKTKKFYSCETCDAKVSSVSARYKLHLCVMDNTSKIKCFLFDSNAKDIVNQSTDEILKGTYDEIQDPDVVPDALQNLVGKTFHFLICVEKENLYGGSNTYKVGKVWKGNQVLTTTVDDANESEDEGDQSLLMSGDQASLMNTHSQESSDDVSGNIKTPLSKRERDDPKDSVDSSSSSKKSYNSSNSVETTYANEVIDEDTLKSDGVLVNALITSESNEGVAKGRTRGRGGGKGFGKEGGKNGKM
ncbi:uncharacterized protein LOC112088379 [Eutrema salsugineum]|uniref:uncharacterized protein LOC112088379 n=1 Tax=Eutrema salsugineum TaxID=72664 RepID=UPI000CED6B2C|nr:uncharacterized protein LOC112088379 [Eutrema salsugineum]